MIQTDSGLTFDTSTDKLTLGEAATTATVTAVAGSGTQNGGTLAFTAGASGLTSGNGGNLTFSAGTGQTAGGGLTFSGGAARAGSNGDGGILNFSGGSGDGTGVGGVLSFTGGSGNQGGDLNFDGGAGAAIAGNVNIYGGTVTAGDGGGVTIGAKDGVGTNRTGGSITLFLGNKTGTGAEGYLTVTDNAIDYGVANGTGTVTISNLAPVGMTATIGRWLPINVDGVLYLSPLWAYTP